MSILEETGARPTLTIRVLNAIERAGNRLPDPVSLFILAIIGVILYSHYLASAGAFAVNPATGETVKAISLLEPAQIRRLFVEAPQIFASFPPLGVVLVIIIGVGLAEWAGLFNAALRGLVKAVPSHLLTFTLVFAGVQSSIASDAGYVVLVPLAAVVFASVGRHPVAGMSAAFAGVAGGFAANLSITTGDALLSGLTQAGAQLIDEDYTVALTANWYFMAAIVPVYALIGTIICDRIVEPRLDAGPAWVRIAPPTDDPHAMRRERLGLRLAGLAFLLVIGLTVFLAFEPGSPLRSDAGGFDPLFRGMVAIMFLVFLACGLAYGIGAGTIRSDREAVELAGKGVGEISGYIVLAFFAAIFVALFSWSNMGVLMAIAGAEALKSAGFESMPVLLLIAVILVAMGTDLLIGSASAKWAILAPVIVPMLMLLGVAPEVTQAAYRVGDSTTNMITPFMSYFPLILVIARKYRPDFGIDSMIALMLPYTVAFFIGSGAFFVAWYLLGLPFGPGVESVYRLG
ncbi:MAG: AbgT family transporter [Alphaproteobacteria bacterium]|nr:AbgT family transporter [Alphaproteobacteria bacterium]